MNNLKRMSKIFALGLTLSCASLNGSNLEGSNEVTTVENVDLERYMGTWYEIASFPQRFAKNCTASKAEYKLIKKTERVQVRNSCRLYTVDGKLKVANGIAKIADKTTNSKLKVSFFWPFFGDYWIIDLDREYKWAVVGSPDRDSLWVLSRTKQMDESLYSEIINRVYLDQNFDITRLVKTPQPND